MPLHFVSGDPFLTRAQYLAFAHNLRGRPEADPLYTRLADRYPVAFSTYRRHANTGKLKTGMLWMWSDSKPALIFIVARDSPMGATRLRYLESAALTLARDYRIYRINSLALVMPGTLSEREALKTVLTHWLASSLLPVIVYEHLTTGLQADESGIILG